MSPAPQQFPAPADPNLWHLYRALVGLGVFCSLLIVSVFQFTAPIIAANQKAALERAIFTVLPRASRQAGFILDDQQRFQRLVDEDGRKADVYAGFDEDGRLVGLAIEGAGMGYQDTIRVLYGYDPVAQTVIGMQVLETKETPGLGDKIETDPNFVANFEALDVALDAAGQGPANPIMVTKFGEKTEAWQIEGITGATISSDAIGAILDNSTRRWLPLIQARLADFTPGGDPDGS